jgi:phage tail-like protein
MGMLEDDFFVRFVSLFQEVASVLLDDVDNIRHMLDVTVTPEPLVRWLGSWLGVTSIDASLPHEVQRHVVREWGKTLPWRGTRRGLAHFLELITGRPPRIAETGGTFPLGRAHTVRPRVRVEVQSTGWVSEEDFVELVLDEIPADVLLELFVGSRQIWPKPVPLADTLAVMPGVEP